MERKVAYVMSRFTHLPETFILREMSELERLGWRVALYPLILQKQPVVHAEAKTWIPRARRLPFVSRGVLAENARTLGRDPRGYLKLWRRALWENRASQGFFIRAMVLFPKAVYAAKLMQHEGITHIHAHYATHPALVAWLIHHLTGIHFSVTVHAHDLYEDQTMLATKLHDAVFVIAISQFNREFVGRVAGAAVRDKTHVIHCGILPSNYVPRACPPTSGERFEIINVGSLQPYKGQRYLVEACARLRDRKIPFRCRVIGGGEEQRALEKQIAEARLQDVVELLGALPQEEVARLLPTAHCYVQPSIITSAKKMEGLPVAIMEALASRLPVVATDISGVPELVRPSETGYLIPPADADALADALAQVYADPRGAFQRAEAGRTRVLQEFDLRANVKELAALFDRVSNGAKLIGEL